MAEIAGLGAPSARRCAGLFTGRKLYRMTTTLAPVPSDIKRPALTGTAALLAAVSYLVLAGIQLTNPPFEGVLTTPADYANDASFLAAMLFSVATVVGLGRHLNASLPAVLLASVGQILVSIGVGVGLVTGVDPDWFVFLGLPGNLIAWVGYAWLGVWAWRRRAMPRWVAALLIVSVPVTLVLADLGGSAVTALLWCGVGVQLLRRPAV